MLEKSIKIWQMKIFRWDYQPNVRVIDCQYHKTVMYLPIKLDMELSSFQTLDFVQWSFISLKASFRLDYTLDVLGHHFYSDITQCASEIALHLADTAIWQDPIIPGDSNCDAMELDEEIFASSSNWVCTSLINGGSLCIIKYNLPGSQKYMIDQPSSMTLEAWLC